MQFIYLFVAVLHTFIYASPQLLNSTNHFFPPSIVNELSQYSKKDWYDPNSNVIQTWRNALTICPRCRLPILNQSDPQYRSLQHFRNLPDRIYLWHTLIPSIVKFHFAQQKEAIHIFSIGQQWYTIEESVNIQLLLKQFKSKSSTLTTMDIDPSVHHMFQNHLTQNALDLDQAIVHQHQNYFDVVIVNGVIGWGVNTLQDAQKLMRVVESISKPGATIIVGRNVPRLCCSLEVYATSNFSPTTFGQQILPWRRTFSQDLNTGGGHVYDVLQSRNHHVLKESNTLLIPESKSIVTNFNFLLDEKLLEAELTVPILKNEQNQLQETRKVALQFCQELPENAQCKSTVFNLLTSQHELYTNVVTKRKHCETHGILIVAHPDDEAIFFGEQLISDATCWTVICATNGNNPVRKAEFEQSMKRTGAMGFIWDYTDAMINDFPKTTSIFTFKQRVKYMLELQDWNRIVTHGMAGDYGHPQHRALHTVVVELCHAGVLNCLPALWCFHPISWNKPLILRHVHESQYTKTTTIVSHIQLERLALLDIYQSQRHVMVWIGKLETKIVPYHQHLLNRSDLLVGCKHPDGVIHLLAKLCKSWINPSLELEQ